MAGTRSVFQVATAAILLMFCPGSASAQKVTIYQPGIAYETCEQFNNNIDFNKRLVFKQYVYGYASGAAIFSGKDPLDGVSVDDVDAYVVRYCRAHPEDSIVKLAHDLFKTGAGRK